MSGNSDSSEIETKIPAPLSTSMPIKRSSIMRERLIRNQSVNFVDVVHELKNNITSTNEAAPQQLTGDRATQSLHELTQLMVANDEAAFEPESGVGSDAATYTVRPDGLLQTSDAAAMNSLNNPTNGFQNGLINLMHTIVYNHLKLDAKLYQFFQKVDNKLDILLQGQASSLPPANNRNAIK